MADCIVNFYLDGVAEGLFCPKVVAAGFVYANIGFAWVAIPVVVAGFYPNTGGVDYVVGFAYCPKVVVAEFVIANIGFACWAIPVVVTGFYPNTGGVAYFAYCANIDVYPAVPVFGLN